MKKKGLALVLALTLLVVGVVAGTLAWLTAQTAPVVNTFTYGDINIDLTETNETYKMVPGYDIHKDPKAKVLAGSEECFLFVKLDESTNFDTYLKYDIADDWTALTDVNGVYYREVKTADMDKDYSVLKGDKVTVNDTVTKEQMNALDAEGAVKPTLTITAYASQLHKNATETFSASEAWNNIANK